ncbi:MAG: 16S rRNA (guanine(966)-N(2))-methyltransferase RsmD [Clostridia bacterium]|nr:16S rRNA (guanine(966)-N(2))-methyltransferase RsmD [Clostridia bacterium]
MRIIAGKFKGTQLNDFSHEGTRPTSDKARGGIFNTLIYEVENGVFLDLFGGTGAMGIEAESRGAKKVYIIDNNTKSIKVIKENCKKCKTQNVAVIQKDFKEALKLLQKENIKLDVVFLDPPYKEEFAKKAIELLIEYNLIDEYSVICYEHDNQKGDLGIEEIDLEKQRKYGIAIVDYYKLKVKKDNYE